MTGEGSSLTIWGADWWDALQALGTLAAVMVALGVPLVDHFRLRREQKQERRRRTASLVSAWVETQIMPQENGGGYRRISLVRVSNESDEPVFEVSVSTGFGLPPVRLGSLSVPDMIPVLPARSRREFDISSGLLGFLPSAIPLGLEPVASVQFRDARGARWHRDYDGTLQEVSPRKRPGAKELTEEEGIRQLGDPSNPFNPSIVILQLLDLLDADDVDPHAVVSYLDPHANWCGPQGEKQCVELLRGELSGKSLGSAVVYSAPRVAHMRMFNPADLDTGERTGTYTLVPVTVLTVVYRNRSGWRLWSMGEAQDPTWIPFPEYDTMRDFRDDVQRN